VSGGRVQRSFSRKRFTLRHFPGQGGNENALRGRLTQKRADEPARTADVGRNAQRHRSRRKRHSKGGGASFFAPFIGQTVAGGGPHANTPSASNLPLSFFQRWDGASMGSASHRRSGPGLKAAKQDPDGNQPQQNPLFLVQAPAGWGIHGAIASAPSARPTSAPSFVRSLSPDLLSSALAESCRSHPDGTPSGGQTWSPNAPCPPATAPPVEALRSAVR
jgi:hypothetical protein